MEDGTLKVSAQAVGAEQKGNWQYQALTGQR
jgi:hypothetical protein